MFGATPASLAMQRQQQMNADAQNYANMDLMQQGQYGMYKGAGMLGDLAAKSMGMVRPEEELAKGRQKIAAMIQDGTPKSYKAAAQMANQMGDSQAAMALMDKSNELEKTAQDMSYKKAMEVELISKQTDLKPTVYITPEKQPIFSDQSGNMFIKVLNKDTGKIDKIPYGGEVVDRHTGAGGGSQNPHIVTDNEGNVTVLSPSGKSIVAKYNNAGKPTATHEKNVLASEKMVKDLNLMIPKLEEITTKGGLLDQSTSSGVGALIDMGAGAVGVTTPGSLAISELKPIADMVLKLVPRFEGPQSDKDTASYNNAAGNLADPHKPVGDRKAAAKVIAKLYRERRDQFTSKDLGTSASEVAAPKKVVKWKDLP